MWIAGLVVLTFERSGNTPATAFLLWSETWCSECEEGQPCALNSCENTATHGRSCLSTALDEIWFVEEISMDGNGGIFFFLCRCKINTKFSITQCLCNFYCQFLRFHQFSPHSWLWNKMFENLKKDNRICAKKFPSTVYNFACIHKGNMHLYPLHLLTTNLIENEFSVQIFFFCSQLNTYHLNPSFCYFASGGIFD